MPAALTISAVNAGTDQLTVTAHGQVTGNGPAAVFVGAGGVIPGGLAPVTDYWLVVVDANTVKLATSSANALANVTIDITSTGTLPLQLLIGLPYRVPMTAAPGAQIKSANDNSTWGALVALWNLLSGQAQAIWSVVTLAVQLVANAGISVPTGQNVTLVGTADLKHGTRTLIIPINPPGVSATAGTSDLTTTGQGFSAGIMLPAGARILTVRAVIKDNVTTPSKLQCKLLSAVGGSVPAAVATGALSAGNGTLQTINVAGLTTVMVSGSVYYAAVVFGTGVDTCHIYACEVDYDRP